MSLEIEMSVGLDEGFVIWAGGVVSLGANRKLGAASNADYG